MSTQPASPTLRLYRRFASLPFGRWLFTRGVLFKAPYFSTIRPRLVDYREGFAQFALPDRRAVHNHLGTVHAIAMCNLAELCGALALDANTPGHLRWIPKGMTVQYLKKAQGDLLGTCEVAAEAVRPGDVTATVHVTDRNQVEVFRADITFYVSAKPARG
ncbi:MAG: DUF4442 domain-containing protein [Aquabacterium sp.]|nr:MAG: DUF4442 domain-containing protein [Aquabacterium sp.]